MEWKKIEFKNVKKAFGKNYVLNDVSFSLEGGRTCGLIGNNGAGKTTIFSILANLITSFEGDVFIDGLSILNFKNEYKKNSFFLFSNPTFPAKMTVRTYIDECVRLRELDKKSSELVFSSSSLFSRKNEFCSDLSTGWKKMLQFLMIEIVETTREVKFLFLDEPFEGLDILNKDKMMEKVINMKKKGITIFISSHNLNDLQSLADNVLLLEKGSIVWSGKKTSNIRQIYDDLIGRK